jgi:hypothetical protein
MLITSGSQLLANGGVVLPQVGLQADTGVLPRADGGPANLPTKKIQADLVERQLSRADGGSLSIRNPKFARTFGQHRLAAMLAIAHICCGVATDTEN